MPGSRARQLDDVAAVQRQFLHAAIVNEPRHRRAAGFDERGRAGHDDSLRQLPEVHLEVDAQVLAGGQLRLCLLRRETRQLCGDLVVASAASRES